MSSTLFNVRYTSRTCLPNHNSIPIDLKFVCQITHSDHFMAYYEATYSQIMSHFRGAVIICLP